jgi:hypothetical protein
VAFIVAALALSSLAGSADAASPAEDAFQEGRRLMAAGQIDEACARFEDSYEMVASSGTLLNLALCHETQGLTASAWKEYKAAARLARNQGREDRATVADGKAQALEPKLARVTTTVAEAVPGIRVDTEEGPLGEGGVGVEVPIDPGTHEVTVTAPGRLPWKTTVTVKEAEQVTVAIPALEAEPLPARATPAAIVTAPVDAGVPPRRASPAPYLAAGAAVALVAGTVLWSVAYANLQSAKDACAAGCSSADRNSRVLQIGTLKDVAIASWVVGGGLAVASGVTYLLHRRASSTTVAIDPIHGGVSLLGTF